MTVSLEDIPAVSPGWLSLVPAERLTLLENGVLTLAQQDVSTLVPWLNGSDGFCSSPVPIATPEIALSLLWHKRCDNDMPLSWLREELRGVMTERI